MDIFNALRNASSQDASQAAESLENLQVAQKRSGAFVEMLSISATSNVALDIRRMAIIQFKNAGVNNWRNRASV
jgi:Importin-beta N-terminal domain